MYNGGTEHLSHLGYAVPGTTLPCYYKSFESASAHTTKVEPLSLEWPPSTCTADSTWWNVGGAVMTAAATGWSAQSLLAQNAQLQSDAQSHMDPLSTQVAASILCPPPEGNWAGNNEAMLTDALQFVFEQTGERYTRRKRGVVCNCPNCQNGQNVKEGAPSMRQHVCHFPKCAKVYSKPSNLRAHLRWHTGERPFHCTWLSCGKRFTRSEELRRHLRTHTRETRFTCTECSKGFTRSDHLSKHVKTHLKLTKERGDGDYTDQEEGDECSEDSSASEASPCEDHDLA